MSKLENRIKGLESVARHELPKGAAKPERSVKQTESSKPKSRDRRPVLPARRSLAEEGVWLALIRLYEVCMQDVFRIDSPKVLNALSRTTHALHCFKSKYPHS